MHAFRSYIFAARNACDSGPTCLYCILLRITIRRSRYVIFYKLLRMSVCLCRGHNMLYTCRWLYRYGTCFWNWRLVFPFGGWQTHRLYSIPSWEWFVFKILILILKKSYCSCFTSRASLFGSLGHSLVGSSRKPR